MTTCTDRYFDRCLVVCDKCLTVSCWYGEFMCDEAQTAGTTLKSVQELAALGAEHWSWWTRAMTRKHTGVDQAGFVGEVS